MGKVRQYYVKSLADKIYKKHKDKITTDFNLNKLYIDSIAEINSKPLRNRIAGYLVILKKNENRVIIPPKKDKKPATRKKKKHKCKKKARGRRKRRI